MVKIVVGFSTNEFDKYKRLSGLVNECETGDQKLKVLNDKDIKYAVFFEDEKDEYEDYINDHYYKIEFEV